jgi:hypothetical protein
MKRSQRPSLLLSQSVDPRLAPLLEAHRQESLAWEQVQAVVDSFLASHPAKPVDPQADSRTS